ncbi:hypothetical protein Pfo_011568 [Paulownia fortunei]|nr:hypothetical protein Pfo_011568 [Paulownia fortunei]
MQSMPDDIHFWATNLQKQASDFAKGTIKEAITEKLDTKILFSVSSTFRIVDLGCSVGPNTFFTMQNLIEAVEKKCSLQGLDSKNMEFQVFFNDHTANDFNTLFASLPPDRQYYAAGVPVLSKAAFSLVLQSVPEEVSDSKSTAWNEGKIHYTGSSREVVDAYADQFEKDMGVFISARAEEIVSGGLMFLIMPGIPDGVSHSLIPANALYSFLGSSLMDLASELRYCPCQEISWLYH